MSPLAPDPPPERLDHEDREGKRVRSGPPSGAFAAGLILLHLTWAAFVAWLLLVVAMNLFFSTKLLAKVVSSSPDSVVMDYRSIPAGGPGAPTSRGSTCAAATTTSSGRSTSRPRTRRSPSSTCRGSSSTRPTCRRAARSSASVAGCRRRTSMAIPRYVAALPPIADRPFPPLAPDPPAPPVEGPTLERVEDRHRRRRGRPPAADLGRGSQGRRRRRGERGLRHRPDAVALRRAACT